MEGLLSTGPTPSSFYHFSYYPVHFFMPITFWKLENSIWLGLIGLGIFWDRFDNVVKKNYFVNKTKSESFFPQRRLPPKHDITFTVASKHLNIPNIFFLTFSSSWRFRLLPPFLNRKKYNNLIIIRGLRPTG